MTAPAFSRTDFEILDRLIQRALADLRSARQASARGPNSTNIEVQERAEENLNALLDYRRSVKNRQFQRS